MQVRMLDNLVNDENVLRKIRASFFPAIQGRLITGYNALTDAPPLVESDFIFDYYHKELDPQDPHYSELEQILSREGLLRTLPFVEARKVPPYLLPRYAIYRHPPEWEKSSDMRIFTLEGVEVTLEEAVSRPQEYIVEQKQYRLRLIAYTEEGLRLLANLFKTHTAVHKLDWLGRPIHISGSHRVKQNVDGQGRPRYVTGAWKVPLLTFMTARKPEGFRDFLMASMFSIKVKGTRDYDAFVEILVKSKRKPLEAFLNSQWLPYERLRIYVLRTFVEDYLEK